MNREDQDHLSMLATAHYFGALLVAAVGGFAAYCAASVQGTLAAMEAKGPLPFPFGETMRADLQRVLLVWSILVGACVFWAICLVVTGRCLATGQARGACFLVSLVNCLFAPLGTLLGVFTILVLARSSVREAFEGVEHES